jgi:hypothetical protein
MTGKQSRFVLFDHTNMNQELTECKFFYFNPYENHFSQIDPETFFISEPSQGCVHSRALP